MNKLIYYKFLTIDNLRTIKKTESTQNELTNDKQTEDTNLSKGRLQGVKESPD